jgi:hypothetical protein
MQYDRVLTKNYAIEICNFLNEEENEGIDFNIQFRRKGDHKGIAIILFVARRQFEFNIYNIHHKEIQMVETHNIDAVHPVLKRVVKFGLSFDKMCRLYSELLKAGYEEENIQLTTMKGEKR